MRIISQENRILSVVVRDRGGVIFIGKADAVSSFNDKGPFDILPLHANFISLINKAIILRLEEAVEKNISIDTGIIKVRENNVEVYIGVSH